MMFETVGLAEVSTGQKNNNNKKTPHNVDHYILKTCIQGEGYDSCLEQAISS